MGCGLFSARKLYHAENADLQRETGKVICVPDISDFVIYGRQGGQMGLAINNFYIRLRTNGIRYTKSISIPAA